MKIYKNISKNKQIIIKSIKKFGFSPEHNYYNYFYKQTPHKRCIFFDFGQNKGLMAIFNAKNNVWYVIADVLAPSKERFDVLFKFIDYIFEKKKAKKISIEASEDFKTLVFKKIRKSKYKAAMNYSLYWPIYNLSAWDEKLSGRQWKKLRNIRNRFYSNLKVKAKNPRRITNGKLKTLLFSWLKRRHPRDRVDYSYYLNIINNNFQGFEMIRSLFIGKELCSISGGWKIPNSDSFYCAIGIFNYKYKDIGDFINLDDLMHLKKMGYKYVDLGGSDRAILDFKKKFKPERIYKTHIFSVSRK